MSRRLRSFDGVKAILPWIRIYRLRDNITFYNNFLPFFSFTPTSCDIFISFNVSVLRTIIILSFYRKKCICSYELYTTVSNNNILYKYRGKMAKWKKIKQHVYIKNNVFKFNDSWENIIWYRKFISPFLCVYDDHGLLANFNTKNKNVLTLLWNPFFFKQ